MNETKELPRTREQVQSDLDFIHGSIWPADVRQMDNIVGRIRRRGASSEYADIRIWKLSPLGVELLDETAELIFRKGEEVDLQIVIFGERSSYEGLIVDVVRDRGALHFFGVRLSVASEKEFDYQLQERRKSDRWLCSDEFFPTCIAVSPGRYNDYIYFKVRDISARGVRLTCSLRNKFLLKGMILKLTMSLPLVGNALVTVRLVRLRIISANGRDLLEVGAEFINLSERAKTALAQYLIQFSCVDDLDSLRVQGLLPPSVANGADFYFIKSEDDYRKVLNLRHYAHSREGNIVDSDVGPEDMADMRDAAGRILVGKYNGKVIATGRISFPDADLPLEQEAYVDWPSDLPGRDKIVELGKVCTDPNFRGSDLFARLIQQVMATCVRLDRPNVVVVALPKLLKVYKKLGCRETGLTHEQPFWNGVQHVLIVNGFDVCLGRGVSPVVWNLIYREPFEYLVENGFVEVAGMDLVRVRIYKFFSWIAPVMRVFQKFRMR